MLKVGELAKQAGVTVRTLHHYDALGLVKPSHRSISGYRLYTADDVARLYMVQALQSLDFSLIEIRNMLQARNFSYKKIIGMQLAALKDKIRQEQNLCQRLEGLERLINPNKQVLLEDIIYLLQIMNNIKQFNLNPEEEEKLKSHWAQFSQADIKAVEAEWPKIITEFRTHMQKGTDPKNPAVQKLAKRWMELVNMFTGGIPKMSEMAKKNLEDNHESLKAQHGDGIPDKEMFGYVQKALE